MSFSVVAAGDVVLNGPLKRPASGDGSIYKHTRGADACFANLEMPLTASACAAEKLIAIKCDPAHAGVLREVGIDVVTVANNHGMDFGVEGLRDTLRALDGAGVAHVGGGETRRDSFAPALRVLGGSSSSDSSSSGTRVAFLGVTTTLPNGSGAGPARPGLAGVRVFTKYVVDPVTLDESPGMAPFVETAAYAADETVLLDAIRAARAEADLVLVGIHWGVPYGWAASTQDEIATYQPPLAHAMIDAGASAVFGHHPHVVHGVELYRGAPVFYSLGNFIFSNDIVTPGAELRTYPPYRWASLQDTLSNIGALAKVSWTDGRLSSCSLVPVTIAEDGEPIEATPADAETLLSRLNFLSKGRGTAFAMRRDEKSKSFEIDITQA